MRIADLTTGGAHFGAGGAAVSKCGTPPEGRGKTARFDFGQGNRPASGLECYWRGGEGRRTAKGKRQTAMTKGPEYGGKMGGTGSLPARALVDKPPVPPSHDHFVKRSK